MKRLGVDVGGTFTDLIYVDDGHLTLWMNRGGEAWGEPINWDKHALTHEVKAITYHGLRVEKVGAEWEVEVIVDI